MYGVPPSSPHQPLSTQMIPKSPLSASGSLTSSFAAGPQAASKLVPPVYRPAPGLIGPPTPVLLDARRAVLDDLDRSQTLTPSVAAKTRPPSLVVYRPPVTSKTTAAPRLLGPPTPALDDLDRSQTLSMSSPLTSSFAAGTRSENNLAAAVRTVGNHEDYDFKILKDKRVEGLKARRPQFVEQILPSYFRAMVCVQSYLLFNGVITIMSLAQAYGVRKQVDPLLVYIAVFTPLVFFLLNVLLFNNYYSERAYYHYLEHNAIIDFPESSVFASWITHPAPVAFLLTFLAYVGFMFYLFGITGGSISEIWVFMSNTVIGVFLFWYRHQGIESSLISLSDYIQSFPNKHKKCGTMDQEVLSDACMTLHDCALIDTRHMCYSGHMRDWWWGPDHLNLGPLKKVLHFAVLLGIVAGAAFAAIYMLQTASQIQQHNWDAEVKPCVSVCLLKTGNCTDCLGLCRKVSGNPLNTVCNGLDAVWMVACSQWCRA